ncbi:hypothetical protein P170DRAFT_436500 [Aspergillus steynii IBT 23096]|uniref:Protein kinase domain-containing protein n=1 Tax=Aspergillus steynii IBT 23096 TaxID=1392250 RepID=A0A2I2G7D4_9EURO|nr:uncharacterized protein P170DRAFT_436500 [Aspergillus steynii IBT 23096]PLB48792.1 hypothetical protein P170DRAFT_436500 [Aspergillus steynii IBT 23096]
MDSPNTFPYTKGHRLRISSHVAPAPTPVTIDCCRDGQAGREERARLTPLQRCIEHPPLPGNSGSESADLEILDPLKVGEAHNAQVFIAEMHETGTTDHAKNKVVAKVYDPLYFDDQDGYLNPFRCVDKHYTHEVHTYTLLAHLQGSLIPKFYGSFSLEIPGPGSTFRGVRLIVIEYIPGLSMLQAHPENYPSPCRQQIVKSVIDFESRAYERDIVLTDLCPRNVMLLDPNDYPQRTIVFLDFGGAIFGRRLDGPRTIRSNLFLGQYISPLVRWSSSMSFLFSDWIDWEMRPWIEAEYSHEVASVTEEMRKKFSYNLT